MNANDFFKNLLKDIKTDLSDEFDRNFERHAFFDMPWQQRKLKPSDNLLNVHGGAGLRGSIISKIIGNGIKWESSLPYATIHNEGGVVIITAKMKKFFWAMYYKSSNAMQTKANGNQRNNKRNTMLSSEAEYWKALALKKVGDKLTIPKRQFIGNHPNVKTIVKQVVDNAVVRLGATLQLEFKKVK